MKTLLQINTVVNSGSTGRIAEEIGQKAMSLGWKSYIAYGRGPGNSKSELIKIGNKLEQAIHGLKTRVFDAHGFGAYSATKQLVERIKEIKPDIIHLHNLHGYYLNIKVLFDFLKDLQIPAVWTLHDCWAFTGHCTYFDFADCAKWKTKCYKCPQKKEYPASLIFDRSSTNYKIKKQLFASLPNLTIVPVSEWLSGKIQESFLNKYPMRVISNGVDTNIFKPASDNDTKTFLQQKSIKNKFTLLGVASVWSPRKNLEHYIKLSINLDSSYQLILLGLTKEQIRSLPQHIIGLEKTQDLAELVQFYSVADIVLNLSSEETFGMTTVEGFSCGTPSIVYNSTASPELITPETGLIVKHGDINGLVAGIKHIRQQGKTNYSKACITRVHQFYNKEDRHSDYISLYNSLIINK